MLVAMMMTQPHPPSGGTNLTFFCFMLSGAAVSLVVSLPFFSLAMFR